ncbi:prenyltransferase [Leptobacterium flavescens]|uniref:Prenyltransferase n=1 Tax=Leptobacterium flavescens TaxID=472055 RepID=A0A6P0UJD2_9FLAO|nr:prenyltransferase [Leptobacterium flavescens]NER12038.1 prenyltransferase [Leptobacterium flavescens]
MDFRKQYASDIELIKSKRDHLGGDFWTTEDNRLGKGSPFSARDVSIILSELGFTREDEGIKELANKFFSVQRPDGRFKISPSGTIYPCHTITALRVLCYLGYAEDERLKMTFNHLLEIQHKDGGWRCNKTKMGKSITMDLSNPGVTLEALDAFRFTDLLNSDKNLDLAVETLLYHWEVKRPLGPCHFGIGTLFMQTEFPFLRYNLFYYCYTLSFYDYAKNDDRFLAAVKELDRKTQNGKLVVENPNRKLAGLQFCKKGETSDIATLRYKQMKSRIS